MAQDTWFNIRVAAGTASDPLRLRHDSIGGAQNSGDATLSFDKAKLNNSLTLLDQLFAQYRTLAIGSGFH
ncbi:MAG: hypothetical protein WAV38_38980 [Xanthobacteraceae bacterium]